MLNIQWFEDLNLELIGSRRPACGVDPRKEPDRSWCRDFASDCAAAKFDTFNFMRQRLLDGEVLTVSYDEIAREKSQDKSSATTATGTESAPRMRKTR